MKFYTFSRLIAIVANTNAHIYARKKQILAIKMIVLEESVYNVYKNLNEDSEQHLPQVVAWTTIFCGLLLQSANIFQHNRYCHCSHLAMENIDC